MMGNKEATDAAFAKAKHVVSLKLNNSRITANSIEPRAAIGQYHPDSDSYTLYSTSQNPHGTRSSVAGQVLKIPETRLRVISPDVGGGFGMKHGGYPGGCARGMGVAPRRRPSGQMGRNAFGGAARRFARPRSDRHRRACARRARQDSGAARQCAACHGLACIRRRHGGAAVRHPAVARRLSDPRGARGRARRAHQHHSAWRPIAAPGGRRRRI